MIVIVAGLPGSGKSFFAEKLAGRIDASYVNSDRIRQSMHASGKYSFQDKLVVYTKMAELVRKLLRKGKTVVVDATFYKRTMRELFNNVAIENSTTVCIIEVIASESLVLERLKRQRLYSEADASVYYRIKDEFEEITEPHLCIESTEENISVMLDKAIEYIHSIYEAK